MKHHLHSEDGRVHCEGNSGDYLLCGLAPEGGNGEAECTETAAVINCRDCISVIEFCRKVRPGEWASTKRGQR